MVALPLHSGRQQPPTAFYRRPLFYVLFSTVCVFSLFKSRRVDRPDAVLSRLLNYDEPTSTYARNLRSDKSYMTICTAESWGSAGATNQLMMIFKMLYAARHLDRVAMIPDLTKAMSHTDGAPISYRQFFDFDHFRHTAGIDLVAWDQIKLKSSTEYEQMACWGDHNDVFDDHPQYKLHMTYWPFPFDGELSFDQLFAMQAQDQTNWVQTLSHNGTFGNTTSAVTQPTDHVLCLRNMFRLPSPRFVRGRPEQGSVEEMLSTNPVWSEVGRHWRFRAEFLAIAQQLFSTAMARPLSLTGRFLAVHIRQGDFIGRWDNEVFALEPYIDAVTQMQTKLRSKSWLNSDLPVVVATDSVDPAVLQRIAQLGWRYINHTAFDTASRYSDLYPAMLDSAVLAHATGFVGTKRSSFSYLAARRVEDWSAGHSIIV